MSGKDRAERPKRPEALSAAERSDAGVQRRRSSAKRRLTPDGLRPEGRQDRRHGIHSRDGRGGGVHAETRDAEDAEEAAKPKG
jgi:hypothetical protein